MFTLISNPASVFPCNTPIHFYIRHITTPYYHPILPPHITTQYYHPILPSHITTPYYHPILPPHIYLLSFLTLFHVLKCRSHIFLFSHTSSSFLQSSPSFNPIRIITLLSSPIPPLTYHTLYPTRTPLTPYSHPTRTPLTPYSHPTHTLLAPHSHPTHTLLAPHSHPTHIPSHPAHIPTPLTDYNVPHSSRLPPLLSPLGPWFLPR